MFGVAAHILERQNDDRGPVEDRFGRGRQRGFCRVGFDAVRAYRIGDILDFVKTGIGEGQVGVATHLSPGALGQHDPAMRGQALQARGDIHAVAIDGPVRVLVDVPEVDADAEVHTPRLGQRLVAAGQFRLRGDRGTHRARDTGKDGENAIAGHIHHAAAVGRDMIAEARSIVGDGGNRGGLIGGHQARITGDIRDQDRREPLFDFRRHSSP